MNSFTRHVLYRKQVFFQMCWKKRKFSFWRKSHCNMILLVLWGIIVFLFQKIWFLSSDGKWKIIFLKQYIEIWHFFDRWFFFLKIRYHETPNISPGLTRVIKQFLVCLYTGKSLYMEQLLSRDFYGCMCFLPPCLGPGTRSRIQFVLAAPIPNPQSVFTNLYPSDCIYRPWPIRIGNNKIQRVHIMLVFLFLLPSSFVTVKLDRIKTKCNLSKKQTNKQNWLL